MRKKIFNKITPACAYCKHGVHSPENNMILCEKKGIVLETYSCRKYRYDALKRVPKRRPPLPKYNPEDFYL